MKAYLDIGILPWWIAKLYNFKKEIYKQVNLIHERVIDNILPIYNEQDFILEASEGYIKEYLRIVMQTQEWQAECFIKHGYVCKIQDWPVKCPEINKELVKKLIEIANLKYDLIKQVDVERVTTRMNELQKWCDDWKVRELGFGEYRDYIKSFSKMADVRQYLDILKEMVKKFFSRYQEVMDVIEQRYPGTRGKIQEARDAEISIGVIQDLRASDIMKNMMKKRPEYKDSIDPATGRIKYSEYFLNKF